MKSKDSEFKPIQQRCVKAYHDMFELHNNLPYVDWNGVQAKHLYIMLGKIKFHLASLGKPCDVEHVYEAFVMILKLLPTAWLQKQPVSVLSGRVSEVIASIKEAHKVKYSHNRNDNTKIEQNINDIKMYLYGEQ
jgi:hypothetical protein